MRKRKARYQRFSLLSPFLILPANPTLQFLQPRQREETVTPTLLTAASNLSFLFLWTNLFSSPQLQSPTLDTYNSITKVAQMLLLQLPDTRYVVASTRHHLSPNRPNQYKTSPQNPHTLQFTRAMTPLLSYLHYNHQTTKIPHILQTRFPDHRKPTQLINQTRHENVPQLTHRWPPSISTHSSSPPATIQSINLPMKAINPL